MRAVDLITSPVRGILNLLKNPVFQVGAVLGVSIGLKDTIDTYRDFEAAMSQVKAISGATGSDLIKLTEKAKEMGATTKFTAKESAEAFNYMAMAGWKTEDMLDGIEGILNLAAASGEDLATTSDIITDALTAFNMKASDAGHFSDVMAAAASNANTDVSKMGETFKYAATMAGTLGYTVEDVALAAGLMANSSIKSSMAGTALNSIITRLATNTSGARDAIEELGVKFYDSNKNARAFSLVLDELRAATANMNDEQKAAFTNTVAGLEAQKGLQAILNASKEDYDKLADAINHADGAAAKMSQDMLDNLQGSITLLQSAVDGVKISFGERLSPYVKGIAEWLTEQMPEIENGLEQLMDIVDSNVDQMQRKFHEMTGKQNWQEADAFGKLAIAWDEFIAEPFSEWWNSRGKAKFEEFAGDIGTGIGTGIRTSILTLLGIDMEETADEGVRIGASFVKGFSEGIDFEVISKKLWQGFGTMLSSAGKLLPGGQAADLSSVLSALMLRRIATPLIRMGKSGVGIGKALFGKNVETGTSLAASAIGSTGNAMVGGAGLLGGLADIGYKLSGNHATAGLYFGDMTGTMSGGAAALAGTGAVVGGVAAGATLISSALDAYKAIKSDNAQESNAYGESAAWKAGGVAAGAAAGAALGSVIPGIGTVIGALVGAGAGGIAGWVKGSKVKEEYQEHVEEMNKEAQKAQKVFEATGLSIEEVAFKSEALTQAMNDSEVSASEFASMFQEECANVAKEAFGDISLSLTEIKKIASQITFSDMTEQLNEFLKVTTDTQTAWSNLESSVTHLKKENWKVGLGMELSEIDKDGYKSAIEDFVNKSQTFIDDSHYEAVVALKLLIGEDMDTTGLDSYYGVLKGQIEDLSNQLTDSIHFALEDGVITLDEAAEIENLQNQISEITGKLSEAKMDAEMQTLQIKSNGAALDIDSFHSLQEELQTNVASASEQYESALTLTLTNLNLQLSEAEINYENGLLSNKEYEQIQEDIQRQMDEAIRGYYIQIDNINARVSAFNLESIAHAWDSELAGILPDIKGSTTEKLTQALEDALIINPDVKSWTQEDVKKWFDLDSLAATNAEAFETIYQELIQTALTVPKETKETMLQNFKSQIPTVEEIKKAVDWDSMTSNDWTAMMGSITGTIEGPSFGLSAEDAAKPMTEYYGKQFESIKQSYSEALHHALEGSMNQQTVELFMKTYMTNPVKKIDFGDVMSQYGPISNDYYGKLMTEWQEAGTSYGNALNQGASTSVRSSSPLIRSDLEAAIHTATASPFLVNPTVNVIPNYNISGSNLLDFSKKVFVRNVSSMDGGSESGGSSLKSRFKGHAAGGYVSGGPQLSWLAEEGYGEFVIPTNPSRRMRALELYQQAGVALGISAHAAGGYVEGTALSERSALEDAYPLNPTESLMLDRFIPDYQRFDRSEKYYPLAYQEVSGSHDNEQSAPVYEEYQTASEEESNSRPKICINMNLSPEIVIHSGNGQNEETILQMVRRSMKELADELNGEIAGKLEEVFSNMPLYQ